MKLKLHPTYQLWIGIGLTLFAVGAGIFYSWCWGWWGQDNLWLKAFFQCNCPVTSEAARYASWKVVVSACKAAMVRHFSPDGRFLLVLERLPTARTVMFDLETGEEKEIVQGPSTVLFLNMNLLFIRTQGHHFILDLQNGNQTTLTYFEYNVRDTPDDATLKILAKAEQVIYLDSVGLAVVLSPDYQQYPEQNLVLRETGEGILDKIFASHNIVYSELPLPYTTRTQMGGYYSRSGNLWADWQGIHDTSTDQLLVPTHQTPLPSSVFGLIMPQGWSADDKAVVYAGDFRYLFGGEMIGYHFPVPQPILLLEVPPQYWPTPAP